ncbi:MAG TPA: hypothetical protein VNP73_08465 [Actinomycetota bacterium]|nr:hypothetical protein [Actinomycetota bacterium]
MRRLRMVVLSMILAVGGAFALASPAQAGPPQDCHTGDLPDPCPVLYIVCNTKPGQVVCRD